MVRLSSYPGKIILGTLRQLIKNILVTFYCQETGYCVWYLFWFVICIFNEYSVLTDAEWHHAIELGWEMRTNIF